MENRANKQMTPIYVMGRPYRVPMGLTIMKALEYAGYRLTRGCGCRGGVCGACVTVYRRKHEAKWQIGLACQTVIEPDIFLVQLPYVPAHKAYYNLKTLRFSEESVASLYPELLRCMGCNTCTRSCPMNLEVMNYVSAALSGDWETVKTLSMECIMCGACAARCPADLAPLNIAMLIRRMVGISADTSPQYFTDRLKDIADGKYRPEIQRLKAMDTAELQRRFEEFQADKGAAV